MSVLFFFFYLMKCKLKSYHCQGSSTFEECIGKVCNPILATFKNWQHGSWEGLWRRDQRWNAITVFFFQLILKTGSMYSQNHVCWHCKLWLFNSTYTIIHSECHLFWNLTTHACIGYHINCGAMCFVVIDKLGENAGPNWINFYVFIHNVVGKKYHFLFGSKSRASYRLHKQIKI